MERYICIHGHFYQPPRENPWLEEVELQDAAYPYHDWNERITAECYAPNTASRILDIDGRIIDIVNNYSKISFDFGPTLLSWMERHTPEVYRAVLEADRLSMERFSGHGSAMAQVYNHMIMPLANRRDKLTQVIWGIRDFERRFGRSPEGMWLPETALDLETLDILADHGIIFTILSPQQARMVRRIDGDGKWEEVSEGRIDPTMAYLCRLPSGRTINLFFYDGPISQEVAFGELLRNGEAFARRLTEAFNGGRDWPQLVHIATDGETYGHHHRGGDMALAYCLYYIEENNLARLTNYAEYLERHPPTYEVEIAENTSWSCYHGVERWRADCGCNTGMHPGWTQGWRGPLREAMDSLRDRVAPLYEEEASRYLRDPWRARDEYISVLLDRSRENVEGFLRRHSRRPLSREEKVRTLKLLEMQRNAMLMYTSCGWFFDEISGTEAVQVMQYASSVIQLAEEVTGVPLEAGFLTILEAAPSNLYDSGVRPYEMFVKPARVDLLRAGAHYCISSIFEEYPEEIKLYCYTAKSEIYEVKEAGRQKLVTGKARIVSEITWDERTISFAVLHLGDHNINAGVRDYMGDGPFSTMQEVIGEAFDKADIPEVIRLINDHFGEYTFSLWHLFRDEQRKVLNQILQLTYEGIDSSYRQIYENNYTIMNFLQNLHIPVPKLFTMAAEHVLNMDIKRAFEDDADTERLEGLIAEVQKWGIEIDAPTIGFVAGSRITSLMERLSREPQDSPLIKAIVRILELLRPLPLQLDLWRAQNIYFSVGKALFGEMNGRAASGDAAARRWVESFRRLGDLLRVKVTG